MKQYIVGFIVGVVLMTILTWGWVVVASYIDSQVPSSICIER